MSLQEYLLHSFKTWKPEPPAVKNITSRDVTLTFCAGPFSFLRGQLLYKVERKEKIPSWVTAYSGSQTTKIIGNLAPCHPHRFRLQIIIKSSAVADLAERAIRHYGNEKGVYETLNKIDETEDRKENNSSDVDNKANFVPYTMDCEEKLLSSEIFEQGEIKSAYTGILTKRQWLESSWSEETWTNTDSDGTSAACFCMAVRCGYLRQVRCKRYPKVQQMLEERPSLISVINYNNGYTPLATAVRKGNVNMVKFLISANAEIEQRSSTGQTPLHLSVLSGHTAVAAFLLEEGANFQARDFNLLRIEHYAVDSCNLDVVKFVFDKGGDVSVIDSNGWTPLFRAVCQGAKTEVIEELVRRGSDVNIIDRAQLTLAAAARLLKNKHGRRRESVLKLVDTQYQHEKVVANFTRLTKKISSVHTLISIK